MTLNKRDLEKSKENFIVGEFAGLEMLSGAARRG
jgi:hypothetical protein